MFIFERGSIVVTVVFSGLGSCKGRRVEVVGIGKLFYIEDEDGCYFERKRFSILFR